MKIHKPAILLILLLGMNLPGQAADKLRVLDKGMDGNQRIYLVTCPNGQFSSVIQEFDIQEQAQDIILDHEFRVSSARNPRPARLVQVCIYPYKGRDVCRKTWKIDTAAAASCTER